MRGNGWFVLTLMLLVAIILPIAWQYNKERQAKFRSLAITLGLEYDPKFWKAKKTHTDFALFQLFYRSGSFSDHLYGQYGGYVVDIFNFVYGNEHKRGQTVVAIKLGRKKLPSFVLRPKRLCEKLFKAADIDFSKHKYFSDNYYLQSTNTIASKLSPKIAEVVELFNEHVLNYFSKNKDFWVEFSGSTLLICKPGQMLSLDNIETFLHQTIEISQLLLRDLIQHKIST